MKQLQSVGRPVSSSALMSLLEVYDSSEWHEIASQDLPALPSKAKSAGTVDNAKLLRSGKELMAVLARAYSRHVCDTDTEKAWMRAVAKDPFIPPDKKNTATLCDSLDAMAVLASESCALNYKFITLLLGMCQNTATRVMLCSMERMHALFMEVLPGRKLRYIDQLDASRQRYLQHHLLTWEKGGAATWDSLEPLARVVLHVLCFEDFLKGAYAAFIQLVTDQLDGGPPFVQRKMLHYVLEMLAKKPEQEGLLLDILVGRLFSNDLKLSAMASAKLTSLLECHGGMKDIVVRRVGSMLLGSIGKVHTTFASHNDAAATKKKKKRRSKALPSELIPILRSIHRGVLFLTEIHFTRKDTKATSEALKCYMCVLSFIFKPSTGDKRSRLLPTYEYDEFSRIIRCISSGLERCISLVRHREGSFDIFDYGSGEGDASRESMEKSIASLFRAARKPISCSTNIGLLSLIAQIQRSEDRFYNLLYERILDIRMYAAVNRRALLTLAANCMSNDKDTCRVAAFVKRLLQVCCILGCRSHSSGCVVYCGRRGVHGHLPNMPRRNMRKYTASCDDKGCG
ncbi:hypothetical protein, conserved [Babesia bigemina]|uniref:CCAAT-binding factor domain-containing protein n=1 Tax=Babesia bigemina TaxID=5866 RepID=A0A061DAW9_BABBI|nr:hypothetical protein, conserved [Babesia bigemina]CDR96069.1 hypothetical protein, conserved [Babesia bigemina]|eukprot:XP_012768255.1 hypothetical protein, conserved [Babesia bigemina]